MDNTIYTPAFPTHPVQDQFGQVILYGGLTKIEYLTGIIAAAIMNNTGGSILPEAIAQEAFVLAEQVILTCKESFEADQKNDKTKVSILTDHD